MGAKKGKGLNYDQWQYLNHLENDFSSYPEYQRELYIVRLIKQRLEQLEDA